MNLIYNGYWHINESYIIIYLDDNQRVLKSNCSNNKYSLLLDKYLE